MALDDLLRQMKEEQGQSTALASSAVQSYKVSPDQAAGNYRLAQKTGVPVHVFPELSDEARLQSLTDSLHQAMDTAPATARFLATPENAQVAHDDVGQLSSMERVFSPFLGFGAKLMAGLASNEAVGSKAIDILTQGRRLFHEDHGGGRFQKSLEQYANDQAAQVSDNVKYWDDLAKRYGQDDTLTGRLVGGLVKAVAGLPAGIVGFHPVFGGLSAAAENAKGQGSDALSVLTSGAAEGAKLKGLGAIFHAVEGAGLGTLGKMALTSGVMGTQTAAEVAGANGVGALASPKGVEEVLSSLVTGAALGYSGMSGEQEVIRKRLLDAGVEPADAYRVAAAAPILKPVINDQARSQEGLVTRDFFNALGEAAGESKLLQRLPEKMREYVQELKKDGPVDNVFVPADAWATYWQDAKDDPARVAEMVTGDPAQYHEALRTGGDLVIPLEDFISKLAGTEHFKGLADDVKLRPGAMSAREAEAFRAGYPDALEELRGRIADGEAVDVKDRSSFQKVYDDVFGQLQGIFPRDTAERYATLTAVRARTRAQRLGVDTHDLYQEAPLKVVAPLPEALRVRTVDTGLDPLLDRLRAADIPADENIFGPSLLQFLRDKGLQDQGGELKGKDINKATRQPGKKNIMREDGLTLDKAREAAAEAGYLKGDSTVRDLLDAVDGELRGKSVYSTLPANERAFDLKTTLDELQGELDRRGIDLAQMSNEEVRRKLYQDGALHPQLWQGGKGTVEVDGTERPVANSQGRPLHTTAEGVRNFWRWFGDSKAVDNEGRPLVYYHGTDVDLSAFDKGTVKARFPYSFGFHFTDRPSEASVYATGVRSAAGLDEAALGGNVLPVYLRTENPLEIKTKQPAASIEADLNRAEIIKDLVVAKRQGEPYDGVVIKRERGDEWDGSNVIVFDPGQVKSVFNGGTWDGNDPRILFQNNEGGGPSGAERGFFERNQRMIGILQKADLSTYLHESGHQWLEELRQDALRPDAPEQIKADWETAKKKMGMEELPDDAPIPREAHEEWARQAEAYLGEGKAPSAELSGLFSRFKLWLTQVYRTMKGLNVNLTDEVRGVMDRLLASDEEIRTAQEVAGQRPLFATAEDAGMTSKEFEAYSKDAEAGGAHARDVLAGKLMGELKREHQAWWKGEKEKVRAELMEEVKHNPVYAALQEVLKGKDFDGNEVKGLKMDKTTLVEMYGEEFLKRLPKGSATEYLYTSEGGVHPDLLAERYGFSSGDEMVRRMIEAPNLKRFLAAETDLRMKERHGDMRLDGSIADQALHAVHNDHWAEVMRAEIKALKKKAKEVAPYKAATKEAKEQGKKDAQATARWHDAEAKVKEAEGRKAHKEELDQLRKEAKAAEREAKAQGKADAEAKAQGKADAEATARWYGAERKTEVEKARAERLAMAEKIPPVKTFREAARQQIGAKPVKELSPQLYLVAEQKAAREAFAAAAKGDYEKAAEARTRQLLNHFLYFEAAKAKEEAEAVRQYAVKMGSTAELGKMGKAGQDFLLQIKSILSRYEFVKVSLQELEARKENLKEFLDRLKDEDNLDLPIPPEIVDEMQKPVNYRELTVDELRSVHDALKMIEHAAKTINTVMADAAKVQLGEAAQRLTLRLQTSIPEKGGRGAVNDSSLTWLEKLKEHAGEIDIPVLRPEFLFERMDGGTSGAWHDFFWNRYNEASAHQNRLREKVFPTIMELTRSGVDRGQRKYFIESLRGSLSKDDIIAIALNAGNESNRDKLQRGGVRFPHDALARPLTDEALQEILSHLTEKDITVVNGIWKAIEKLRPDAAELARKRTGIEPQWIEASPLEVRNGTLAGGYFPLKYDPRWSAAGEKQADSSTLDQLFTRYAPASTRQGYMKERTDFAAPLSLDWQGVTSRHLDEVITDISHWQFASQAQKLLKRADVKEAVIDRMGHATYKNLLDWVRYTVNQDSMGREASDNLEKLRRSIRTKASTYILGFKVQNAIADAIIGIPLAVQRLDPTSVFHGSMEYLRNPKAVHRLASEASPYMRSLDLEMDRNLTEALNDLAGKHSMLDDVRRWSIESRVWAYKIGATAAWISGYREAQRKGMDGVEAVRYGDKVVRMTQDAGRAGDLSAVERNPNMKELTMYIGPTLIQYNNNAAAVRRLSDQGINRRTVANAAKVFTFGYLANAVIYEMLRGRNPDDTEKLPAWLLARLTLGMWDGIPIGRDIAAYAEGKMTGEAGKSMRHIPVLEAGKTAVDAVDALAKAATGEGEPRRAVTSSAKAVGAWTGLPALQGTITGEYIYDVLSGQYEPEHAWSPVTDVFNRRKNHNGGGPR